MAIVFFPSRIFSEVCFFPRIFLPVFLPSLMVHTLSNDAPDEGFDNDRWTSSIVSVCRVKNSMVFLSQNASEENFMQFMDAKKDDVIIYVDWPHLQKTIHWIDCSYFKSQSAKTMCACSEIASPLMQCTYATPIMEEVD